MQKIKIKFSSICIVVLIPLLVLYGVYIGDRNYALISVVFVILAMTPFFSVFERRKPRAREVVPIAIMSSIAAVGRFAFAMLPHFKPVLAIVIVTGISFGPQAGFMTGALSALISNFFFGQGPWTPWQMFAFGIVGFLAGQLNKENFFKNKFILCSFGLISGYIYGIIVNVWVLSGLGGNITVQAILSTYIASFPLDTIHAVSTVIFLYIIGEPMLEKMVRVKKKYGLYREVK